MRTCAIVLLLAGTLWSCSTAWAQKSSVKKQLDRESRFTVRTDPNVETLGIIFSLSEDAGWLIEHSNKRDDSYFLKLFRQRFGGFSNHPAVTMFDSLSKKKIISIVSLYLALHYSPLPEFELLHEPDSSAYERTGLEREEFLNTLENFALAVRGFYQDTHLEDFFRKNQEIYRAIVAEVESTVPGELLLDSLTAFYGTGENLELVVVPSPTMFSQWGFGHSIVQPHRTVCFQLLSHGRERPFKAWEEINPKQGLGFADTVYNLECAVHEFGHSFVRFLDKPENKALVAGIAHLNNQTIRDAMNEQGQGDGWDNVFEEHLVRATEVFLLEKIGMAEYARKKLRTEVEQNKFLYLEEVVGLLHEYDANRATYSRFELFLPVLVRELSAAADADVSR